MLTESFIAAFGSVANSTRTPAALKDAGACEHAWQPVAALAGTFRRSASDRNGLAVSDTHVFTAQAGKAVLHVYGRGRRNQEATVPLHERVHSIALAGGGAGAALAIGTEGGRLVIWEVSVGAITKLIPKSLTLKDIYRPPNDDRCSASTSSHVACRRLNTRLPRLRLRRLQHQCLVPVRPYLLLQTHQPERADQHALAHLHPAPRAYHSNCHRS